MVSLLSLVVMVVMIVLGRGTKVVIVVVELIVGCELMAVRIIILDVVMAMVVARNPLPLLGRGKDAVTAHPAGARGEESVRKEEGFKDRREVAEMWLFGWGWGWGWGLLLLRLFLFILMPSLLWTLDTPLPHVPPQLLLGLHSAVVVQEGVVWCVESGQCNLQVSRFVQ